MPKVLDNSQRFRYAILFQWIVVGISLVALASRIAEYLMLQKMAAGVEIPHADVEASDWRQEVIGDTQLLLIVVAFIAVVLWAHRAYVNLHRLHKVPAPRHSEGAAGWGWFVPVLNFWYPYQVMKDIWKLTQQYAQPGEAARYERDHGLIGGWWALRIFIILASRGFRAPVEGATMAQVFTYVQLTMGMNVLYIWYAVTTVYLLKKLRPFEQQLAARFADDQPENALEAEPSTPMPIWYGPMDGLKQ